MHLKETLKSIIHSEISYQKFSKYKCIIHNEAKIQYLCAEYDMIFFPKNFTYILAENLIVQDLILEASPLVSLDSS